MNRVMTAGLDRRWRGRDRGCGRPAGRPRARRVLRHRRPRARGLRAPAARVTGLDFSERMLERAREKSSEVEWVQGDAARAAVRRRSFDAATVGFGVRNLADLERGLAELRRVLRPGGRLGDPRDHAAERAGSRRSTALWFDRIVPLLGKVLPGGAAYTYLPASVRRFPGPEELAELLRAAGFDDVRYRLFAGGIVALHIGSGAREPRDDPRDARARRATSTDLEERLAAAVDACPGSWPTVGARGARGRRQAAAAAARLPGRARGRAAARGRRRGRARAHGDARARRPDRPAPSTGAAARPPGRATAPTPRAPPATTSSRGRSPSSRRPATSAAVGCLADATLALARGEAMQRAQTHDPDTTVEAYLERCALKTGKLFEAACLLGSGGDRGPRRVRARARDRLPDRRRHPRLLGRDDRDRQDRRHRPARGDADAAADPRRARGRVGPAARSPAARSTARWSASPRPARSSARARSRSTTRAAPAPASTAHLRREELEALTDAVVDRES